MSTQREAHADRACAPREAQADRTRRPALSPSRASDFKQCPLLYRFRAIDRLPEPPSTAQLRGSVVHAALEQLYALPATDRGPDTALSLVIPAWEAVSRNGRTWPTEIAPELRETLLKEARTLLSGYYRLEDPTRFDPQSCEQRVEVELADGTLLRGFVDRIDVAPSGELRVVDYKTGKAPPAALALAEFKAMFQMKFYAVALLRIARGRCPPTAAAVPRRWPGAGLFAGARRAGALREDLDGNLEGHPKCRADRRFSAQPVAAVQLVHPSATVSGIRRHSAALPGMAAELRRRMSSCYYHHTGNRRRLAALRIHREHRQQLGSAHPARFSPAGPADYVRSRSRPRRTAGRSVDAGHPGCDSGCAGTGSGVGVTAWVAHLHGDGRDDGGGTERLAARGCSGQCVAAGRHRHP